MQAPQNKGGKKASFGCKGQAYESTMPSSKKSTRINKFFVKCWINISSSLVYVCDTNRIRIAMMRCGLRANCCYVSQAQEFRTRKRYSKQIGRIP